MVLGLSLVVPETQTVLQATRDLPAGAVIGPDDVTVVKVRVPEAMASSAYSGTMADQVVGRRTALRIAAGQLLMPTEFETAHVSVAAGRVQVTIPVDAYTASGGQIGPGDTVVIYASPKQQGNVASATMLVDQARVIAVGRVDGTAAAAASSASGSASTRPLWITLDLEAAQGAQVTAAARTQYVDVGLVSTSSAGQTR
jgi:Flp pilus assembly protein CpaB